MFTLFSLCYPLPPVYTACLGRLLPKSSDARCLVFSMIPDSTTRIFRIIGELPHLHFAYIRNELEAAQLAAQCIRLTFKRTLTFSVRTEMTEKWIP